MITIAIRIMGYGLWVMVYGLGFMVYGLWFMVYGLWVMGYGLWVMSTWTANLPSDTTILMNDEKYSGASSSPLQYFATPSKYGVS